MKSLFVFLCAACLAGCDMHEPVGLVLIYEIDPEPDVSVPTVSLDEVATAVRKRLRSVAKVETAEDRKIKVSVYGHDPTSVERLLSTLGSLQFRIVADAQFPEDKEIIALAKKDEFRGETRITDVGEEGKRIVVARWVSVVPTEVSSLQSGDCEVRENGQGETEALVLIDEQNVTAAHVTRAWAGTDQDGRPCVHIQFNADGAKRFGRLTSNNLPDEINPRLAHRLAIILDGRINSAPIIRSRIDDQAQITGNFTQQEVTRLAGVLMSGIFPFLCERSEKALRHRECQTAAGLDGPAKRRALALPPARDAGGMAKPLAKLVALLTPKRRWFQFRLITVFFVVTALCVWLAVVVNWANRQHEAVAAIEAHAGEVEYEEPNKSGVEAFPKRFLRRWLVRDYFDRVQTVRANGSQILDADLAHLQSLTGLQGVSLQGTSVTDAGLAHLQGLTGLKMLSFGQTQVTDAGVAHLQGLTELRSLWLSGTPVTDTGLAHLQGHVLLVNVDLSNTHVTDDGLEHLRGLVGLKALLLDGTRVSDAGLAHLKSLNGLKRLCLRRTQVTDVGLADLQQVLPNCEIISR